MTLEEKLDRLGISHEDFEFYCATFIHNWTRYRKKKPGEEWLLVKRGRKEIPLKKDTVTYHLLGKYWLAIFAPKIARYLSLDLDPSPEMLNAYSRIRDWLDDPIVFQSSTRNGLHIYAFLSPDFPIRTEKLFDIAKSTLNFKKVETKSGICEIFPSSNKSLRLPLGMESVLLDCDSLKPLCTTLKEAIAFLKGNLRRYTFEELFPDLWRRLK